MHTSKDAVLLLVPFIRFRSNERVAEWPGRAGGIFAIQASGIDEVNEFDLPDWEFAGEVIEFSFDTVSGGWLSEEAGKPLAGR